MLPTEHLPLLQLRTSVRTLSDIRGLELRIYLIAGLCVVGALVVAAILSHRIQREGGPNPSDPRRRRFTYWAMGLTWLVGFTLWHLFGVGTTVAARWQGRFNATLTYASLAFIVAYVLAGYLASRVWATSKVGHWFGAGRR